MKQHHPQLKLLALATAAALLAAPLSAAAQDTANAQVTTNAKFKKLDANQDGFLSKQELRGFRDYSKAFDEADENKDGRLDADEFIKSESIYQRQQAAKFIDDSVLTAKVKAALIKEARLQALEVGVETYRGQVLLSGFVDDEALARKAVQIAASVDGVVGVKNGLAVK